MGSPARRRGGVFKLPGVGGFAHRPCLARRHHGYFLSALFSRRTLYRLGPKENKSAVFHAAAARVAPGKELVAPQVASDRVASGGSYSGNSRDGTVDRALFRPSLTSRLSL